MTDMDTKSPKKPKQATRKKKVHNSDHTNDTVSSPAHEARKK